MKKTAIITARLIILVGVMAHVFSGISTTAFAEDARGLALSPIRTEITVDVGTAVDRKLQLTNYSNKSIIIDLDAEEFNVTDQQYDYVFSPQSDTAKWVMYAKNTVQLAPGKSEVVSYKITVPANAEPGGRYISLFATSRVQDDPSKIQTRQRVASLTYLTVNGNVTRIGSLQSLDAPFVFDGYQKWKMILANDGTTHYRSRYDVSVTSIVNGSQVATVSGSTVVLPHTKREVTAQIPVPRYVGIYKVSYTIGLGDTPAAKREYYMIFLPKQMYGSLISLTIIVTIGVSYVVWKQIRRKKTKN